jgi:hypothetical protein
MVIQGAGLKPYGLQRTEYIYLWKRLEVLIVRQELMYYRNRINHGTQLFINKITFGIVVMFEKKLVHLNCNDKKYIANFIGRFWSILSNFYLYLYIHYLGFESFHNQFHTGCCRLNDMLDAGLTATLSR